jgi:MAF protein
MQLILASSSPYRAELLSRLGLPFQQMSPEVDEAALKNELPESLVARLARDKAQAVATALASGGAVSEPSLIIGSDQVLSANGQVLTKPGTADRACQQLAMLSGRAAELLTGVAMLNTGSVHVQVSVVLTQLQFRQLSASEIAHYVATEKPLDCAGAFKAEGLGISLFEHISSDDPTAIIGLPLIRVVDYLRQEGLNPLQSH